MNDPILATCERALRDIITNTDNSVYARLEAIRQLRMLDWEQKVGEYEEQDEEELDEWLRDFKITDNIGPYEIL